jgi:hypothetical protein
MADVNNAIAMLLLSILGHADEARTVVSGLGHRENIQSRPIENWQGIIELLSDAARSMNALPPK